MADSDSTYIPNALSDYWKSVVIRYDVMIFIAIAIIGALIKLFYGNQTTISGVAGPANAVIWGYGTIVFALFGILIVTFALASQNMKNVGKTESMVTYIKHIIYTSLPIFLLLGVLGWLIQIYTTSYTKINKGQMAKEFSEYSSASTLLIIFQLLVLCKYVMDEITAAKFTKKKETGQLKAQQLQSITYVLTLLNLILAGMLMVIAEFLSTDG